MHTMILCCTLRASYSWSLTGKPPTLLFCLRPTGRRPIRIHACDDCLLRISERILPMLMNRGHTFLSPEKFVRQVWSDVKSTGIRDDPIGSLFYSLFITCSCIRRKVSIPMSSTTNHQYACLYIRWFPPHRIRVSVQKPDVRHRHVAEADTESYLQCSWNKMHSLGVGGSRQFLWFNLAGQSFHAFYFAMYTQTENGSHRWQVVHLTWKTDQYLSRRVCFHGRT